MAEAGFLQPFTYFQLVFGTSLGIFLFGEILQTPTLIGMIVIVAAGLFTLWRAQKPKKIKVLVIIRPNPLKFTANPQVLPKF